MIVLEFVFVYNAIVLLMKSQFVTDWDFLCLVLTFKKI